MQFRILGPLEVLDGKGALPLGGTKQRAVLAVLLLHANEVVSADRLLDELWGERPPDSAANALQVYVSGLRKVLEPKRAAGQAQVLVTKAPGYLLKLEPESLDALCFEGLARQGRSALAEGRLEEAAAALREALSLWRGEALVDFAFERFAQNEIMRLDELRLSATEDRIEAELSLGRGRHLQLVAELEALVGEHPLRERLRAQLMLALYRAGRQADALELYRSTRRLFLDELGIEPSPALQRLEQSILRQEAALELALPAREELFSQAAARKPLTAIVVDLEVPSASGAPADPEAGGGALAAWLERASSVIERYGGSVEELPDGALLGLFGIPVVREDDALRAALAAQEIRASLADEGSGAPAWAARRELRIGLASGRALVGGGRGAAGIAGIVREATRLLQRAQAGEALVGEATLGLLGASIEAEQTPEGGWSLRGIAAEARAIPRQLDAPLIGRSAELGQLLGLFEDAVLGGRVQLVSLIGAPGIGKTRLAKELGSRLVGSAEVLHGHCPSFGEGLTFWPLAEIVRRLAGEDVQAGLESLLAPAQDASLVAERLAGAIAAIDRETPPEETFWATRRMFELLAARRPLLIVLDDLHWAEPTFLELVAHLAQASGKEAPALIVCLARPEFLASRTDWPGTRIELEPLDGEATDALLARLLAGAGVAEHVRARIGEAAEGNPLFIEQMVAMLGGNDGEEREFAVPPTIEALLAARLDLLLPDERRLVEAAAIAGREFSLDGVVKLLAGGGEEALDAALERLHRKQFLSPAGGRRYRFRHELIRDAAYEAIPKLARSALHLRYADWLEQEAPAPPVELEEIAAYHLECAFLLAQEVDPRSESLHALGARAAGSLRAAGERAHARGDMPTAISLLKRAQALPARSESERAQLLLALAGAQREVGDFEAADDACAQAIALASSLGNRALESKARILRLRMQLQTRVSLALDELVRSAEQTIGELEVLGDEQGLGEAWSVLAWMSWLRCRAGPTAQSLDRALVYAHGAGDETTISQGMHLRIGAWLFGPTPVTDAIACCEEVLTQPHTQRRIEASAYRALAGLHAMLGRFEEARSLLEQGRAIIDELGLRVAEAVAAEIGGMVELLAGDPAAAEERLRAGIAVLEPMGETSGVSTLTAMLAEACYQQGRPDEVLELSKLSARLAPDDDFSTQVQWRGPQAKVLAARGRTAEAEALASEAVSLAAESDFLNLRGNALLALAEVLQVGGRLAEARSAAEEARALFEQKGNVVSSAGAHKLIAELPLAWAWSPS